MLRAFLVCCCVLAGGTAVESQETNATTGSQPSTLPTAPIIQPNKTVCYPYVGCFDNYPPFDNAHLDLPNTPAEVGTQIILFTRNGPATGVSLDYKDLNTVTASPYNPSNPTKIIIHGFSNTIKSEWLHRMKDELLKKGDFNVLIVAWGPGASFPDYDRAVANTRLVATQVRLMVDQMTRDGATLDDVHIIGHSLGAHTAGYVGRLLHGRIRRITGLDPAEPDFEKFPEAIRLDETDAKFVDVIHSNGAPFSSGGAGLMIVSGHVDFFPNGGETQPGCPSQISGVLSNIFHGNFGDVTKTVSCSHSRSHELFTESINSDCPFTAYPCESQDKFNNGQCFSCNTGGCSELGYYADQYLTRGKLYLETRDKEPFCGFHYAVKFRSVSSGKATVSIQLKGTWGASEWIKILDDEEVSPTFNKVVVSVAEVGDLKTLDIKYEKHTHGFFWGSDGPDNWTLQDVSITSGELGTSYHICPHQAILTHAAVKSLTVSSGRTC